MNDITLKSLLGNAYSISKKIVENNYKDEIDTLYPVWIVMKEHLSKWKAINPDGWSFSEPKSKLMASMGFARPSQMSNMAAPGIIAMTAGVLWNISRLDYKPEEKDIERIIDDCSNIFKISSSLKINLKELLVPLCLSELPNIFRETKEEEIKIEIFERGNPVSYSEMKIKELKDKKTQYDIWVYKTFRYDEEPEILIDKKPVKINDQALKLLICLLKASGRLCGYSEVLWEAWRDPNKFSKSKDRGKIVQAWGQLKKSNIIADNIKVEDRHGFQVNKGINYCIIYSTQLFLKL